MFEILKICGKNIRLYRKKRGLTLSQMSNLLGITSAYLGYLERGQRNPSLLTLTKIANLLHIPPWVILREPQDYFEEEFFDLQYMLFKLKEVKHVIFLKEVLQSYLKLMDNDLDK